MENLKEKLIEYLESNNLKYRDSGDKIQHNCINPEHQENSPSAFTSFKDIDNCFTSCSSCGYHLNHNKLVKFLGGTIDSAAMFKNKMNKLFKQLKEKEELSLVVKEENLILLPPKEKPFKATYRGISSKTFEKVGAFITPESNYYKHRIIFPLLDYDKTLLGFDAVSVKKEILPKVLRSKNTNTTTFFGFENLLSQNDYKRNDVLFICEGLFSSLSFIELGYKSVYNFGVGSIENKLEVLYKSGVKTLIFCGDFDQAGRSFNTEMYHLLKKSFNVTFFKFPYGVSLKEDSNDLMKKGLLETSIGKTLQNIL